MQVIKKLKRFRVALLGAINCLSFRQPRAVR